MPENGKGRDGAAFQFFDCFCQPQPAKKNRRAGLCRARAMMTI